MQPGLGSGAAEQGGHPGLERQGHLPAVGAALPSGTCADTVGPTLPSGTRAHPVGSTPAALLGPPSSDTTSGAPAPLVQRRDTRRTAPTGTAPTLLLRVRCPRALLIPATADVRRVPRVPSAALIRTTELCSGARIFVRPLRLSLSHPLPRPLWAQSSVSAPPSRLHPRLVSPSLVLPLPLLSPSPAVCFPPFLSQVTR